jgi:hypothetical protein
MHRDRSAHDDIAPISYWLCPDTLRFLAELLEITANFVIVRGGFFCLHLDIGNVFPHECIPAGELGRRLRGRRAGARVRENGVNKWRRALEAAGVMFIDPDDQNGPDVRPRGAKGKR